MEHKLFGMFKFNKSECCGT